MASKLKAKHNTRKKRKKRKKIRRIFFNERYDGDEKTSQIEKGSINDNKLINNSNFIIYIKIQNLSLNHGFCLYFDN